jgi:hypothetical protein
MRTEQEVLAYLYRKRDGALSGATRVVYAEVISAIEGDLFGDPNETSTPRRFDDRAVLCDRDAPAADHRRRTGSSDLRAAVRDRRHLAAERRPSADPLEGMQVSGPVAELLLKGATTSRSSTSTRPRTFQERRRRTRRRSLTGTENPRHPAEVAAAVSDAEVQRRRSYASPATRHRQQPAPGSAVRTD